MYDGLNLGLLSSSRKLSLSIFMEILFVSRRQKLSFGEVGHMVHVIVLSKNIRACIPFTPLPDRWWKHVLFTAILAPLLFDVSTTT